MVERSTDPALVILWSEAAKGIRERGCKMEWNTPKISLGVSCFLSEHMVYENDSCGKNIAFFLYMHMQYTQKINLLYVHNKPLSLGIYM